jgi:hypothetical protein
MGGPADSLSVTAPRSTTISAEKHHAIGKPSNRDGPRQLAVGKERKNVFAN